MSRALPVVDPFSMQETGEVACPLKMWARIARQRCVENQKRDGCGAKCPSGPAAVVLERKHRSEMRADDARAALARQAYADEYRASGALYQIKKRYGRRPRNCVCCGKPVGDVNRITCGPECWLEAKRNARARQLAKARRNARK